MILGGGFMFDFSSSGRTRTREEKIDYLMNHCVSGDVRVQHMYFAPAIVSALAWKDGNKLHMKNISRTRVGIVRQGSFTPANISSCHTDQSNPDVVKAKLIAIGTIVVTTFTLIRAPVMRTVIFVVTSILVLVSRVILQGETRFGTLTCAGLMFSICGILVLIAYMKHPEWFRFV